MTKNFLPSYQEGKAIAAATLLLKLSKGICDKYWLNKVMYYLERESLIRFGQPMFNDSLFSVKYGPIVSSINDGIDNAAYPFETEWNKHIVLNGINVQLLNEGDFDLLSENEIDLIQEIFNQFEGKAFGEMKAKFHSLPEYKETKSRIDIEYVDILRPAGIDEESIADALETISYFNYLDQTIHCVKSI